MQAVAVDREVDAAEAKVGTRDGDGIEQRVVGDSGSVLVDKSPLLVRGYDAREGRFLSFHQADLPDFRLRVTSPTDLNKKTQPLHNPVGAQVRIKGRRDTGDVHASFFGVGLVVACQDVG